MAKIQVFKVYGYAFFLHLFTKRCTIYDFLFASSDDVALPKTCSLLLQCLLEPEFYGDLVYKFSKIIGKNDFPYHFKKIIVRDKNIG